MAESLQRTTGHLGLNGIVRLLTYVRRIKTTGGLKHCNMNPQILHFLQTKQLLSFTLSTLSSHVAPPGRMWAWHIMGLGKKPELLLQQDVKIFHSRKKVLIFYFFWEYSILIFLKRIYNICSLNEMNDPCRDFRCISIHRFPGKLSYWLPIFNVLLWICICLTLASSHCMKLHFFPPS